MPDDAQCVGLIGAGANLFLAVAAGHAFAVEFNASGVVGLPAERSALPGVKVGGVGPEACKEGGDGCGGVRFRR
jgi:hypothetical protein